MKLTRNNYQHIKKEERDEISILLRKGYSYADIGRALGRDKSTISREIAKNRRKVRARGGTRRGPYEASVAHHKASLRRQNAKYQGRKIWLNKPLKAYLEQRIRKGWPPDIISGRMKLERQPFYVSKTAIYEFIYSPYGQNLHRYLPSKRHTKKKRKQKKTKRELIPNRIGIEQRPARANKEYGHFEGDTIVSGRKHHSKKALSVIYARKAKYVAAKKISCLKPNINNEAVKSMAIEFDEFKTLTLDNGIENIQHEKLREQLKIDTYFCDPFSAWQKPGVENVNKLIRRFIPKGSDIGSYSDRYIENVCKRLNNTPRKSLGYKTPKEVMIENNLLRIKQPIIFQFEIIKNTSSVALEG